MLHGLQLCVLVALPDAACLHLGSLDFRPGLPSVIGFHQVLREASIRDAEIYRCLSFELVR